VPLLDELLDKLPPLPGELGKEAQKALDDLLGALDGKPRSGGSSADVASILDYLLR
jgi:hypothetical protein